MLKIIKVNFADDMKTIINILLYNGPMIKDCISVFNSKIRPESEYQYLIKKLEQISVENNVILVESSKLGWTQ